MNEQRDPVLAMFPQLDLASEEELGRILGEIGLTIDVAVCPYTNEAFDDEHPRCLMLEEDSRRFKVGAEEAMKVRSLMYQRPYATIKAVNSVVFGRFEIKVIAREAEKKRKQGLLSDVLVTRAFVERIVRVDGKPMDGLSLAFESMFREVAAQLHSDEAMQLYIETHSVSAMHRTDDETHLVEQVEPVDTSRTDRGSVSEVERLRDEVEEEDHHPGAGQIIRDSEL